MKTSSGFDIDAEQLELIMFQMEQTPKHKTNAQRRGFRTRQQQQYSHFRIKGSFYLLPFVR